MKASLESEHFKRLFSKRRISRFWKENDCPANDILARETALRFGQHVFLGDRKDVEDIVAAIVKVQANAARPQLAVVAAQPPECPGSPRRPIAVGAGGAAR